MFMMEAHILNKAKPLLSRRHAQLTPAYHAPMPDSVLPQCPGTTLQLPGIAPLCTGVQFDPHWGIWASCLQTNAPLLSATLSSAPLHNVLRSRPLGVQPIPVFRTTAGVVLRIPPLPCRPIPHPIRTVPTAVPDRTQLRTKRHISLRNLSAPYPALSGSYLYPAAAPSSLSNPY